MSDSEDRIREGLDLGHRIANVVLYGIEEPSRRGVLRRAVDWIKRLVERGGEKKEGGGR